MARAEICFWFDFRVARTTFFLGTFNAFGGSKLNVRRTETLELLDCVHSDSHARPGNNAGLDVLLAKRCIGAGTLPFPVRTPRRRTRSDLT